MKKLVGFLQKVANLILGLVVLSTIGVLLYAKFGNGWTPDLSKLSISKNEIEAVSENTAGEVVAEDNGIEETDNLIPDYMQNDVDTLNQIQPVGTQTDDFASQIPELSYGDDPVSNMDIAQIQDASKSRPTIVHSGEEAVTYVQNLLDRGARFSGDGNYSVNGENYYRVNSVDSEGIFYVSPFGEIHFLSRSGEWVELNPYEPSVTAYSGPFTLEADLVQAGNCVSFLGFRHDMTFREVMNKLIQNTNVKNQLIENYREPIYFTTARYSSDKVLGKYDNIEILDKMGDYYFEGFPVHLNFKFNAEVTGVKEDNRYNSNLMEIRARLYNLEANVPQCATKTEYLINKYTTTYGNPATEVHNKFSKTYTWKYGEDVMVLDVQRTVLNDKEYWYMSDFQVLKNYNWR